VAEEGKVPESLQDRLRLQWLEVCGVDRQRGTRLIAKHEVIENL
jgi:hypothetical protein